MSDRAPDRRQRGDGVRDSYPFVETEASGLSGGFSDAVDLGHGSVIVVEVDDIEATLRWVEELGWHRRFPAEPAE